MAFSEDTGFKTGDSLFSLTRKILSRLNQGISTSGGGGGGGGGGAVTIADGTASGGAAVSGANSLKVVLDPTSNISVIGALGSGTLTNITNPVTVAQTTPANLKAQISVPDGNDVTQGATADAKATDSTSAWSVVALLKGIWSLLNGTLTVGGNVGGKTFSLRVTPTISTSAYSAGFTVGAIQTLTSAVTSSGGTGILESLVITDKSNQKAPMDIYIFESNPAAATTTDHAAFTFSTDIGKVIARVSVSAGDYVTTGSVNYAIAIKSGLGIALKANGSANLFAVAVTSGTPTYGTTTDLNFVWGILQD